MKHVLTSLAMVVCCSVWANCQNAHCCFEYNGYVRGQEFRRDDFIGNSVTSETREKYFQREFAPLRELDWLLYNFERSVENKDGGGVSNAVNGVVTLLRRYSGAFLSGRAGVERKMPLRLRMDMLEKIEYSLARIVLGKGRSSIQGVIDVLIPKEVLIESKSLRCWHSIVTFKNMIRLAAFIEDYRAGEGCCPLNLNMLSIPEEIRKCGCGRDIEYECHVNRWVLRSRCESYDGGLGFDEYIPMIYNQRKRLDLCFSPSFNEKRRVLFSGAVLSEDDNRIAGRVSHDATIGGVHGVTYNSPSAGCGRIVPLSEQRKRSAAATLPARSCP